MLLIVIIIMLTIMIFIVLRMILLILLLIILPTILFSILLFLLRIMLLILLHIMPLHLLMLLINLLLVLLRIYICYLRFLHHVTLSWYLLIFTYVINSLLVLLRIYSCSLWSLHHVTLSWYLLTLAETFPCIIRYQIAKATNTPKCKSGRLNLSVDMTTSTLCRNTAIITLDALYSLLTSVKYTILYSSDMPHQRPLLQTVFPKTANWQLIQTESIN